MLSKTFDILQHTKGFHPPENLIYPFCIATQRVVRSSCILNLKNERLKLDYLKLALKISKLRYHGEEPSMDLLLQAHEVGCLAHIPDDELDNLLFNLDIQ